jgi:hypothetical protein
MMAAVGPDPEVVWSASSLPEEEARNNTRFHIFKSFNN